jgi:hypothetical protein
MAQQVLQEPKEIQAQQELMDYKDQQELKGQPVLME